MIFEGISVARNYPAPSAILAIKRGLLCNLAKNFKNLHFMGHRGRIFSCYGILNLQNFLR